MSRDHSPEAETFEETRTVKAIDVGSPPKDIDTEGKSSLGRSRSRSWTGGSEGRPRTRSKSGSPDSWVGSPYKSRSNSPDRRSRSWRSQSPEDNEEGCRLHVADLSRNASKKNLEDMFSKFGKLEEVWMAQSVPCFGFVVFQEKESAKAALEKLDGEDLCGRCIRVTFAKPRTRGRNKKGFDPNMRCYQCGEKGHFSRDCPGPGSSASGRYRGRTDGNYSRYREENFRDRRPREAGKFERDRRFEYDRGHNSIKRMESGRRFEIRGNDFARRDRERRDDARRNNFNSNRFGRDDREVDRFQRKPFTNTTHYDRMDDRRPQSGRRY